MSVLAPPYYNCFDSLLRRCLYAIARMVVVGLLVASFSLINASQGGE